MMNSELPTDRQDTDGFIRPEVQHPDKRFHLKHADADDKASSQSNATYDRLRHRQRLIGDDRQR